MMNDVIYIQRILAPSGSCLKRPEPHRKVLDSARARGGLATEELKLREKDQDIIIGSLIFPDVENR